MSNKETLPTWVYGEDGGKIVNLVKGAKAPKGYFFTPDEVPVPAETPAQMEARLRAEAEAQLALNPETEEEMRKRVFEEVSARAKVAAK